MQELENIGSNEAEPSGDFMISLLGNFLAVSKIRPTIGPSMIGLIHEWIQPDIDLFLSQYLFQ